MKNAFTEHTIGPSLHESRHRYVIDRITFGMHSTRQASPTFRRRRLNGSLLRVMLDQTVQMRRKEETKPTREIRTRKITWERQHLVG